MKRILLSIAASVVIAGIVGGCFGYVCSKFVFADDRPAAPKMQVMTVQSHYAVLQTKDGWKLLVEHGTFKSEKEAKDRAKEWKHRLLQIDSPCPLILNPVPGVPQQLLPPLPPPPPPKVEQAKAKTRLEVVVHRQGGRIPLCKCEANCDCGCNEGQVCICAARCSAKTVRTAIAVRRVPHFKAVYAVVKVPGGFRLAWAGPLIRTEEEIGAQVEMKRVALAKKGILMEVWVPAPDAKEEHVQLDFTPPPKAAPEKKPVPKAAPVEKPVTPPKKEEEE